MPSVVFKRLLTIRSVPSRVLVLTVLASVLGQLLGGLQGWPLWGIVLASLIPWVPLLTLEMAWAYRHYHWLALFYVLVLTQGGHVVEHVAQIVQIHVLDLPPSEAHGIFGALDIEWVHFVWNTWVLLAVALLVYRFRGNRWLWATLVIAGWHEIEHAYIMSTYVTTGQQGTPGLLAQGGAIAGGVGLSRPDLHFYYNLLETTPLVVGFAYQVKHTYDEWLAKALPRLSEALMIETTNRLETRRFERGEVVLRQGEAPDNFYILVRGEVEVLHEDQDGIETEIRTLGPGQFFGEIGLLRSTPRTASVRAKTPVELLALDREGFQAILQRSDATAEDLTVLARQRLAADSGGVSLG